MERESDAENEFADLPELIREQRGRFHIVTASESVPFLKAFTKEETERLAAIHDEQYEVIAPRESVSFAEFARWAQQWNELRNPSDKRTILFMGPDGSVMSPSKSQILRNAWVVVHNHHHPKDDPNTPSSSKQWMQDFTEGKLIRRHQAMRQHIFVKRYDDCDQDVCLYDWLTRNWRKLMANPDLLEKMKRFTDFQDPLDVYVGLVPIELDGEESEEKKMYEENAWVFEPYSKIASKISEMSATEMHAVIAEVRTRLDQYAEGKAKRIPADTRHKVLLKKESYVFIEPQGMQARMKLCKENRIVVCTKKCGERYRHSIGQVDKIFLPYEKQPMRVNLVAFGAHLNRIEGFDPKGLECWGGRGNKVLASPKNLLSGLSELELEQEMLAFLEPIPPNKAAERERYIVQDGTQPLMQSA